MHKIKPMPVEWKNEPQPKATSYYGQKPYYLNMPSVRKRINKENKPEWRFEDIDRSNKK